MIVCPQCGKSFPEGETRCASCGYAAPKVEPPRLESTPDDVANPLMPSDLEPRDVPSNVFKAVYMCFNDGGFDGRSSRTEFWFWFFLLLGAVVIPLGVEVFFFYTLGVDVPTTGFVAICFSLIWGAICFIPSLSLCVRRFQDVGVSGVPFAFLLCLAPFSIIAAYLTKDILFIKVFFAILGTLLLFVVIVALIPGTDGVNRYGPKPRKRQKTSDNPKSIDGSSESENNEAR